MEQTTIAAAATPAGQGGIAIVRLSGPDAQRILGEIFVPSDRSPSWQSHLLRHGHAVFRGEVLDECMAVLMKAPRSYTREDVAELHLHGGRQVVEGVLQALFSLGASPAGPGEFTKRAFLNGRIDLSGAEAVMSLIAAGGARAASAALRQLSGGTAAFVRQAQGELVDLLAGVAAAIDFPEEVDADEAASDLAGRAERLADGLESACDERGSRILREGMEVAIVGKPNVGKSSLLNALLSREAAIVTDIPGTTRDVVRGSRLVEGLEVIFSDTAGMRESGDAVEKIGIRRAKEAMRSADLVLAVLDASRPADALDRLVLEGIGEAPHLVVLNKRDLGLSPENPPGVAVSAKTGEGIRELLNEVFRYAGTPGENALTLERHLRLARKAAQSLRAAAAAMERGEPLDLCAVELHDALLSLGEITGDRVTEELLDSVFSTFCVGK